jgi:hypothetical protein
MMEYRVNQKVAKIQSCLTTHSSRRRFAARLNRSPLDKHQPGERYGSLEGELP